jgi:VWFA-related protein
MRTFSIGRAAAFMLLVALPAGAVQTGETQGEVQLRGDLVEVRAVVTDKDGRPRDDLTKQDFEVRENGVARDISFFSVERTGGDAGPSSPSSFSSGPAPAGAAPGSSAAQPAATPRTVVFFVDAANMPSPSVVRVKKSLGAYVDTRLSARDLAAVVSSGGSLGLEGQFTHDRALLRAAIEKISPRPASFSGGFTPYLAAEIVRESNPEALAAGIYLIREQEGIPPEMDADRPGGSSGSMRLSLLARQRATEVLNEATRQRRIALASLRATVERLARAPGQRLLALVSDGFTLFDRDGGRDTDELKAVIARAVRSGVVIYSLSASGLESGAFSGADDPLYTVPPQIYPGYGTSSRRDLEDGVTALAKDTGGEVFRNTNDFGGALDKMLDANRVYYVLAYYPEEGGSKGPRTIEVRLKNRPGLSVRAQRGYDASTNDAVAAASPVVDALTAPSPPTAIPVVARAELASGGEKGEVVALDVYVAGDVLQYTEQGEQRLFDLEVATAVFGETGASVETKVESLAGRLAPRALDLARANGFHVRREVALAPGRYQLRVAVREPATGRIGTASAWLDVPDVAAGRLALGGFTLSGSHDATGEVFAPRTPRGVRTYAAGDFLIYSAVAFNAGDEARASMRIAISQGERVLFRSAWEPLASRATGRGAGAVRLSGQLGLSAIPAGAYTLRVEVRDADGKRTAAADAAFAVDR